MKLRTQLIALGLIGLAVTMAFQNCSPGHMSSLDAQGTISSSSLVAGASVDEVDVLQVEKETISSQLMCEQNNSLSLTIKKSAYENFLCTDQSTLIDGVAPGATCVSGVTVNQITSRSVTAPCNQLKICDKAPTSLVDLGNGKLKVQFDNLPWGCHAKLKVSAVNSDGSVGHTVKQFNFKIQPPACRSCASTGIATCGACADPGCSVAGSDVKYNVNQTKEDPCPVGTTGTGLISTCTQASGNFSWVVTQAAACTTNVVNPVDPNPPVDPTLPTTTVVCSVDGSSVKYAIGERRIESCASGQTGTGASFKCVAANNAQGWAWESLIASTCVTPAPAQTAIFKCSQLAIAGQYCINPNSKTETPSSCPAGKKCAGGAADPVACGDNKYSVVGESVCHTCANVPADMTFVHSLNYAKNNTSATCAYVPVCKANAAITPDGSTCAANCAQSAHAGQYCEHPSRVESPLQCPAGSSCAGKTADPVRCAAGKYAPAGSGACADCTNTISDMTYVHSIVYAAGNVSAACGIVSTVCKQTGKHPSADKISCVKK